MDALASSYAFWIALIMILATVYLVPTLIGAVRRVANFPLLIILNLLGGLTCIGWPAALITAFMLPKRAARQADRWSACPLRRRPLPPAR